MATQAEIDAFLRERELFRKNHDRLASLANVVFNASGRDFFATIATSEHLRGYCPPEEIILKIVDDINKRADVVKKELDELESKVTIT